MQPKPTVYILASKRNGTLSVGVTGNLVKRVWEHRNDLVDGFTKKYGVHTLLAQDSNFVAIRVIEIIELEVPGQERRGSGSCAVVKKK